MEKYGSNRTLRIVSISRSKEGVGVESKSMPRSGVVFSLVPCIVIEEKKKFATVVLESQFFDKEEKQISNKLVVNVCFFFDSKLPIVKENGNKASVNDYKNVVSMLDTSIGVLRGILHEWLGGTILQKPLPYVDIEELIKNVKVNFRE